jgi:hypothetical protein
LLDFFAAFFAAFFLVAMVIYSPFLEVAINFIAIV